MTKGLLIPRPDVSLVCKCWFGKAGRVLPLVSSRMLVVAIVLLRLLLIVTAFSRNAGRLVGLSYPYSSFVEGTGSSSRPMSSKCVISDKSPSGPDSDDE